MTLRLPVIDCSDETSCAGNCDILPTFRAVTAVNYLPTIYICGILYRCRTRSTVHNFTVLFSEELRRWCYWCPPDELFWPPCLPWRLLMTLRAYWWRCRYCASTVVVHCHFRLRWHSVSVTVRWRAFVYCGTMFALRGREHSTHKLRYCYLTLLVKVPGCVPLFTVTGPVWWLPTLPRIVTMMTLVSRGRYIYYYTYCRAERCHWKKFWRDGHFVCLRGREHTLLFVLPSDVVGHFSYIFWVCWRKYGCFTLLFT